MATTTHTMIRENFPALLATEYPGADASAKLANAIAALPASGGTIDARGLSGVQAWTTTVSTNKSVSLLLGHTTFVVSAPIALSVTGTANLTVHGFYRETLFQPTHDHLAVIDFSSNGFLNVEQIMGTNGGIPQTSGFLVHLHPSVGCTGHRIAHCVADGLHIVVLVGKANGVWIYQNNFVNAVNAEIKCTYWGPVDFDAATVFVSECVLSSGTGLGVGILLEDVGGMYVNNCHILGHAIGISAGCTQPHAFNEVWVTGNRIGLQEAACIVLQRLSGSGFYAQANISDNYLGSPEATFVTCVQLGAPGGVGDIAFTSVSDNRLTAGGASVTTLLAINSGSDVYVDSNDFVSANPANVAIGLPSASYSDVRIGRNKYTNFTAHQTITGPPVLGVVFEPDLKVLTTVVNPPSIASGISLSIPVNVPGVRPSHGDSVLLQRPASLNLGLALIGQGVTSNDLAFVVLHNTTGGLIDDGPSTWTYTWIDMVP